MSKKNKYKQPGFVAPSEVSSVETVADQYEIIAEEISAPEEFVMPEPEVIVAPTLPVFQAAPQPVDPQRLTIADAASRLIVNFKPHHLPGIQAFAKTQGYSEHASADEYADLFRRYGLKVKK